MDVKLDFLKREKKIESVCVCVREREREDRVT
jgi:hypothetical protein